MFWKVPGAPGLLVTIPEHAKLQNLWVPCCFCYLSLCGSSVFSAKIIPYRGCYNQTTQEVKTAFLMTWK